MDESDDEDIDMGPWPSDDHSELGAMFVQEEDQANPSRVTAPRGFYTIPGMAGRGNSFICFRPHGDQSVEWVAAQIQGISKARGSTTFRVRRSVALVLPQPDPFKAFWSEGFEAKMVSSAWAEEEYVEEGWIVGHTARWEMTSEYVVVLNLKQVRDLALSPNVVNSDVKPLQD